MTTTCLINCFNYAQFVGEAIEGALRQTAPFDEIIIVDDGSTDGTLELVTAEFGNHPVVQIVGKHNEGQLSCFNEGFARATGDIVFFLDADDVYEPTYVQQALDEYLRDRCDFLFCGRRYFGDREGVSLKFSSDRDLGYSVIRTIYSHEWIGGGTSCLSMRRQVLEKILPLPFVDDWRTRADDCLVFGASLVGARKRFLAQPLVRYRVHSSNQFCGRKSDTYANYRRRLAVNRLFEYLRREQCYNVAQLANFPHREFETIERPSLDQLFGYARISLGARVSILRRMSCIASMFQHFVIEAWRGVFRLREDTAPATQQPVTLHLHSIDTDDVAQQIPAGDVRCAA
jgi:glycosyltransferase involved in cell wall biosynthesis